MKEEFLHHIWKFKLFDTVGLRTTENEEVEILKSGEHNFDSGPDFFNGKIRIGNTLWAGNVEIHTYASDWKKHHHQKDKAYDNIILHVVHEADEDILRGSGEKVPTVELKSRIKRSIYQNYLNFNSNSDWIPCEKQIQSVPSIVVNGSIDKLVVERLERKSTVILQSLSLNHNNWEETFYQLLARNFGFNTNSEAFELLAKSLPLSILLKHKNSLLQLEAMLYGQAGMLEKHLEDKYALGLQNEYVFLKKKFKLHPIDAHLWKLLRMRPVNFPSIRIAQFAQLIYKSSNLFSSIMEAENFSELHELLEVSVSEYWTTHYLFDKMVAKKQDHLGADGINNIIINTIVPFLFVYGKHRADETLVDRSLAFLERTAGESNSITAKWKELKLNTKTGYATQALLQLKNEYCSKKRCLNCNIGNYLLKNS